MIQILKRDDLKLVEIEIWEYLIKWGIENTDPNLDNDLSKWLPLDFMELEKLFETVFLTFVSFICHLMIIRKFELNSNI